MTVLANPNDVCVNTFPFSDFSQSLGTTEERLESSLSMLVYVFVAATIMPPILLSATCF